jgi:YD repeat-containing protein
MYRRVAKCFKLRTAITLTICIALLPTPGPSLLISGEAQAPNQGEERKGRPRPGKPEGVWPNLDEPSPVEHEAPVPIPSTIHSRRNSGKPWDGRRVGDPPNGTERGSAGSDLAYNNRRIRERRSQTRRAHARARMTSPPPPHDQFVSNFFTYALVRSPASDETTYWYDQLRVAYANGATSLKLAGIELGRTLFESAEYAARNRDAHWYVYDLYKTYLMRDPDAGGWAMWEGLVPTHGREYVRRGFEESGEFATLAANITTTGAPSSNAASLISARVDPRNQPGNGMLSRDTNWSVPLLSLPGRAGLDLGLAVSYSSMVWTRSGPYIYFDEDNASLSPGFRIGFPAVQRRVFDTQTAKNAYLMITPAGRRVELRQVGTSNIYDAADSSYLRLTEDGALLRLHSTDGTRLTYSEVNSEYRCTEVKDRNGNYLTVNHNGYGQITTITDTLGRVITFNYDSNSNLNSITQLWNGQAHTWATFGWTAHTMQSSFGTLRVVGTANNTLLPLLKQVGLPNGDRYEFEYTNAAQVSAIRRFRSGSTLAFFYTVYQYESTTTDVPRLNQTRVAAENWTSLNGVPGEVITNFAVDPDGACRMTAPDGTVYKEYYGTGWQKGLTTLSEVLSGGVKQKWITTAWTQDNTAVSYEQNPRVTETNVYDAGGNRRRTTINYGPYAQWGLPYSVKEYAADGITPIRETLTDYNLSQAYVDRRIIGLVSAIHQTNISSWQRKIGFTYDDPGRLHSLPAAATQHDATYNTSFTARGNLTAVSRWDVNDIINSAKALTSYTNYFTTGTAKSTTDPAGHQKSVTYADSFSDNMNRNTFAYPTTITNADGFSSTVQYNFDFGGTTRTQGPPPVGQSQGAIQTTNYDSIGRVARTTTENKGAYTRYEYGPNFVRSFSTVNNIADEAYAIQVFDGVGRVIATSSNHPGSSGGYRAQMTIYDLMGRAVKTSNPTEITAGWVPTGDDTAGWLYTQQTYDWQGRPLLTTNTDLTTKEASYAGCGCAGGSVVTLTDEGTISGGVLKRRQQKIYSDVLGRTVKTEILNWQNGSVYSTTVNSYNARDQLTQIREYAGVEGSGTSQDTAITYDGYGRLQSRHAPEQAVGTATVLTYNADDTTNTITDARGASQTFSYNARHLLTNITYAAGSSGAPASAPVTFNYDAAGNRSAMTDGLGNKTYQYNELSRLTQETRQFTVGTFAINYTYNLAGQLTGVTDPFGASFTYTRDVQGRLKAVTGSPFAGTTNYITDVAYRAWDSPKSINYGAFTATIAFNARMKPTEFRGFVRENYSYFPDGSVSTLTDLDDTAGSNPPASLRFLSRAYTYDHVGRMTSGFGTGNAGQGVPFSQSYSYNAFGNMTIRSGRYYNYNFAGPITDTATYVNNRRNGWSYNADGEVISTPLTSTDPPRTMTYDTAGRMVTTVETGSSNTTTYSASYDGDDEVAHESLTISPGTSESSYIVRSSVLDGEVLTRLNQSGNKKITHVPAEGLLFATQRADPSGSFVLMTMRNPFGTSESTQAVYDPLGNYIPFQAHGNPQPPPGSFSSASLGGLAGNLANPYGSAVGCMMDGLPTNCNRVQQAINRGEAKKLIINGRGQNPNVVLTNMGWFLVEQPVTPRRRIRPRLGWDKLNAPHPSPGNPDPFNVGSNEGSLKMGFRLVALEPQATESWVPARNLLPEVFHLLDNNRCFTFISNLLNVARQLTGRRPYSYDAYELAVTIATRQPEGGVRFTPGGDGGGSAGGDIFSGSALAGIALRRDGPKISHVGVQVYYALVALHEFIHLAGGVDKIGTSVYNDYVLARAVNIYTGAPGYPSGPPPTNRAEQEKLRDEMDDYWDNQLWEHCNPLGARR